MIFFENFGQNWANFNKTQHFYKNTIYSKSHFALYLELCVTYTSSLNELRLELSYTHELWWMYAEKHYNKTKYTMDPRIYFLLKINI